MVDQRVVVNECKVLVLLWCEAQFHGIFSGEDMLRAEEGVTNGELKRHFHRSAC